LGLALAATVVAGAVVLGPSRRPSAIPPPRVQVVERLTAAGVAPFQPVALAATASQHWLASDIETAWTRVGTGEARTYRSPALGLAPGNLVAIVATFPQAAPEVSALLLWASASTLTPQDFARNRRALEPSTDGGALVLRRESVESSSGPLQHLFVHLPPGLVVSSSLAALSVLRHADITRHGPVGPLRVTMGGETRDAVLGAVNTPLTYALTKPADSVSFGVHVNQTDPLTVRVRQRHGDTDSQILVAPIAGAGWHDLTAMLANSAPSTITVEAETTAPAVVTWSTPVSLAADTAADKPHIIVYVVDALRADALGLYGAKTTSTPTIDALGRLSAVFERAYAAASWTKPSIATLLTSLYPSTHGLGSRFYSDQLPESVPTLQSRLAEAGYRTAQFPANPFSGALSNLDRGFDVASTITGFETAVPSPSGEGSAAHLHDRALEWFARHRGERTFAYIHAVDTHPPFSVRKDTPRASYEASLASLDSAIGTFRQRLQALGFANVLFVLTADHGEAFGEHGRTGHGQSVYEEEVRVPLVMHWPGRIAPARLNEPLHHVDVVPTILALVDVDAPAGIQGVSLWPFSRSSRPSPIMVTRFVYPDDVDRPTVDRNDARALVDFPWKLVLVEPSSGARRVELYRLDLDPGERRNIADQEPARVRTLTAALEGFGAGQQRMRAAFVARYQPGTGSPRHAPSRDLLDQLRSLGYVR
jgi:arylsulfatase A-like enzyme